jgi:membrane protein required for colicin V production
MFDIFLLLVFLLCVIIATISGLVKILFSAAALLLSIIGAVILNNLVAPYFISLVPFLFLAKLIAFVVIFIIIFLVIKILQHIVSAFFKGGILKGLDRALGFIFGIVEGVFFVVVILFVLVNQPFIDVSDLLNGSHIFRFLEPFLTAPITIPNVARCVENGRLFELTADSNGVGNV